MNKRIGNIEDKIQKNMCGIVTESIMSINFLINDASKEENIKLQFNIDKLEKVDQVTHL